MPTSSRGRVLVTGGAGFLGSWVVRKLLACGYRVRSLDLRAEARLAERILGANGCDVEWMSGDVGDPGDVQRAMEGCEHVVHIAALLTPACRANPAHGAAVNLLGTIHVFEAAKRCGIHHVVYASTAAVFGPDSNTVPCPVTHYGAFKLAAEGCARSFWFDAGVGSVGLRPLVIYGPGRELGPTAGVTLACQAAARCEPYTISFTGRAGFMHVEEVASAFAHALHPSTPGAAVYNCWGDNADVEDVIASIRAVVPGARIKAAGPPTGVPADVDSRALYNALPAIERISLGEGIRRTIQYYIQNSSEAV